MWRLVIQYIYISSYLNDFNETAYTSLMEADPDSDMVAKLAWNPLAAFRTLWRFENYVKPWMTGDLLREQSEKHGRRSP